MVKTMRAVKIPCEDTIELHQVPIPEPQKGWVRIKMKASALCRSDLYRFHGQKVFEDTGDESFITPGSSFLLCILLLSTPCWRSSPVPNRLPQLI